MIICASVFAIFCNKYLQFLSFFWNQFLGLELHAQKVWIIAKWLAYIAFQKGCSNLNSIRRSVHAGHWLCLSHCTPPPPPHLSFKKLPSPICKVSTDCSLRNSFPVSFGQRNRPTGSCSPGLTVDSGLLRRRFKETPFKCEGKIYDSNKSKMDGFSWVNKKF